MYFINDKISFKGNIQAEYNKEKFFLMGTKNKAFKIAGNDVKNIKISNKRLANPLVTAKVLNKYKNLLYYLTELLTDDDDSGDSYREALNQIEKFRLIIKNKYRDFLKKKELEMMSKQLLILQKEANNKLLEIHNSYLDSLSNNKSR